MKKRMILIIFALIGVTVGMSTLPLLWNLVGFRDLIWVNNGITNALIGALVFLVLASAAMGVMLRKLKQIENYLSAQSPTVLLFGSLGAIIGLALAAIISIPFYNLAGPWNAIVPFILMLVLGYLGLRLGTTRRDEWRRLLSLRGGKKAAGEEQSDRSTNDGDVLQRRIGDNFRQYKLLDTSVIIDGRVQAIAKIGFLEGTLLVPTFVVRELQALSDSADALKRGRGRRGLDIINAMKKDQDIALEMYEGDFEDMSEVDMKLLKLAKMLDAVVMTNDFNLNKVATFQNVPVLNINALANALKPDLIPGEKMTVTVMKDGTERQQGVAYLADGTMVVVEDGQFYMNKPLEVVVTSAIQTAAGRMIFAKPTHQQTKLREKTGETD